MNSRMAIRVIVFLTLTGLCVADSKGNLAIGATAVQSSTAAQEVAQHAVDGSRNPLASAGSCSHTNADRDPWWRVDLLDVYRITRVSITNRGDCCAERINGAQIRIGNSLENNGNNNDLAATVASIPLGDTKSFEFQPVTGRYVNIIIPGRNEFLTLCEVEVFAENYTPSYTCVLTQRNLAIGARAVQSSTAAQEVAQHAVDGNRNPLASAGSCSHTKWDKDPWWRVDLLDVYKITRVSITNRGDCCAERINGAQIRIGNSLENNGNNNQLAATVVSIPPGVSQTFEFKPVNGRFVNIIIPGRNEFLTLCEVEVFAGESRNLALGAKAVQSSTYDHLTVPQNAVDGNRNSDYHHGSCSHTNGDKDPWWRVDLLNVYKITRVSITNRGDCCAERINGAQIRIGNSLQNNGNSNKLAATVVSIPLGQTKTFEFNPIKGRYVNIFIPGRNEYLTLCEVEVFAEKDTPLHICVPRNLAFGGTAVQSSTYDHLTAAHKAVDGNRNSIYTSGSCSHTKADWDPWWRVDLLNVYRITRVSITNRGDCCAERINGAQIRIGNSLANNGNNNQLAATVGPISLGETRTFKFHPIKGRYVNIFIPGRNEYLTLCEVEVFSGV
ncbi:uncharacterized protein LOC125274682 [Megalobrama amblycephala]|uniref:uncharacterized protein LOC125274682 n=1 Tax=Megalobrama amblycephala TaxID=75352 RepID=UPI0020145D2A|nr:uncharacterized protein LOC125274682 [Megalobrama amblycephala]